MGESDLPYIMALVQHELSEPYVIYTYRYFLHQWYAPFSYLFAGVVLTGVLLSCFLRPHLAFLVSSSVI